MRMSEKLGGGERGRGRGMWGRKREEKGEESKRGSVKVDNGRDVEKKRKRISKKKIIKKNLTFCVKLYLFS